ncbi:MAG: hypothetical protein ACFE9L_08520 [Candidatus Hodarchaeota archaeon]
MGKQQDEGGWATKGKDSTWTPMHKSTLWNFLYLDYLGLNGSVIPNISKAIDYAFQMQYNSKEQAFVVESKIWGRFMQCQNAMVLRSMLKMGFEDKEEVKNVCLAHLRRISGKEGLCKFKKGPKKTDRFQIPCAWGLVKDLLFFNSWPESWRDKMYKETVDAIQKYLLSHNLATADFPRIKETSYSKWFLLAYFRSYYADIIEVVEALIESGVTDHPTLNDTLIVIGEQNIDEKTWICQIVPSWDIKLEKKLEPSPWLTLRGLKILKH